MILLIELLVSSLVESVSDLLHQLVVKIEVMENGKAHSERLSRLEEMSDISSRVVTAGGASAFLCDGTGILCVLLVEQIYLAAPGEEIAVTGVSRGHNAVEEVDATIHSLNNILRRLWQYIWLKGVAFKQ